MRRTIRKWTYCTTATAIPLAAGLLLLAALPAAPARAQQATGDALIACGRYALPDKRLACFDDLVRRLETGRALGGPLQQRHNPATAPSGSAPPATSVANVPPPTARQPSGQADSTFGLRPPPSKVEHLSIAAHVVRHWENHAGQLVVKLDNGQIWTEAFSYDAKIPRGADNIRVVISEGKFGGFRMRIGDKVGLVKVKRLR